MNEIATVLDAYTRVRARDEKRIYDFTAWTEVRLRLLPRQVSSHDEVLRALDGFGAAQSAWICTQGSVRPYPTGLPSLASACIDGHVIALEAANEARSIHVRLGDRGWWVIDFCENAAADGDPCIARGMELLGSRPAPGKLAYRVFWRHDSDRGFVPYQARFVGFVSGRGGEE